MKISNGFLDFGISGISFTFLLSAFFFVLVPIGDRPIYHIAQTSIYSDNYLLTLIIFGLSPVLLFLGWIQEEIKTKRVLYFVGLISSILLFFLVTSILPSSISAFFYFASLGFLAVSLLLDVRSDEISGEIKASILHYILLVIFLGMFLLPAG